MAVAPDGSVYLAGGTHRRDLPATAGYQPQHGGGLDVYLARFTADLLFDRCTYLGGSNDEGAYRVALDAAGNVYLMGVATRILLDFWTFPVTPGVFLTAPSGDLLLFVAKFDTAGDLACATFLGPGEGDSSLGEWRGDLAVDPQGNAYVVAVTTSANFPITPGAFQTSLRGFSDLAVSKLNPEGTALVYSTYFGGSAAEYPNGNPGVRIAVNAAGNVYVAANTDSRDLPLELPFESRFSGRFLTKLNATGRGLEYSSYVNYRGFGVEALALRPREGGAAGTGAAVAVYVGGRRLSRAVWRWWESKKAETSGPASATVTAMAASASRSSFWEYGCCCSSPRRRHAPASTATRTIASTSPSCCAAWARFSRGAADRRCAGVSGRLGRRRPGHAPQRATNVRQSPVARGRQALIQAPGFCGVSDGPPIPVGPARTSSVKQ